MSKKNELFPTHMFKEMGQWFYLFHALLALLILYPLVDYPSTTLKSPWVLIALNTIVVINIIHAVSYNLKQYVFAILLGIPALSLHWIPESYQLSTIAILCTAALYIYCIIMIIAHLSVSKEVKADDIFASLSLYLLLGLSWCLAYELVELWAPGSFYISSQQNIDHILNWSDFLYFSFVTLTTLGYGDITPITSTTRSLTVLESVTGVMFIAVFMPRTIGLYLAKLWQK